MLVRELPGFGAPGGHPRDRGHRRGERRCSPTPLGAWSLSPAAARAVPLGDRPRLVHARPARARPSRAPRRARRRTSGWCRSSASTTGCCTAATPRARAPSSCSSASATSTPRWRERGGGLVIRHGRAERELAQLAARGGGRGGPLHRRRGPVRAPPRRCASRALRERGVEPVAHPGVAAVDDLGELRTQAGRPYTVFTPFHRRWLETPRRDVLGAPRTLPAAALRARARAGCPSLASLGLEQEVDEPPPGGEAAGARAAHALPRRATCARYADNHDALGRDRTSRLSPYLHFGCVSAREVEERLPRGRGRRRRSGASSAGATSTTTCCCTSRATRARSSRSATAAASRWSHAEQALRGLVRGPHRLPAGGRRHAPAAPRGLDAQPRAARGRLVPHQGPRHRLALGRALVHAPAGGRRRGQQQRQLAVDRLGGHRSRSPRSGASTTRRGTWSATTREGDYVRRYVPELRDVPDEYLARAVDDARGGPARGGLRDRRATTRSRSWTTPRRAGRRSSATGSRTATSQASSPLQGSSFAAACRYRPHVHRDEERSAGERGHHPDARADAGRGRGAQGLAPEAGGRRQLGHRRREREVGDGQAGSKLDYISGVARSATSSSRPVSRPTTSATSRSRIWAGGSPTPRSAATRASRTKSPHRCRRPLRSPGGDRGPERPRVPRT